MKSFHIKDLRTQEIQHYLQHAIAPRPICFASTVDQEGRVNLSPFSFFNLFSLNPPVCVFSPSRRVRDNTNKHTYENIREVPEVVINIVNYAMVQQTSLASTEYPKGVNEFVKAGFTELPSELVKPPRVRESPVQLECKVRQVIELSEAPGAGNLVLAEVLLIHIRDEVLDETGRMNQAALDLIARLGGNWYTRVTPDVLFEVEKPLKTLGIGIDRLPEHIRHSKVLTGNHLGQLANVERLPDVEDAEGLKSELEIQEVLRSSAGDKEALTRRIHQKAAQLLNQGEVEKAWKILLVTGV